MPYFKLDKTELVDLQYSATKETLRTNRYGSYSNSTISGCNTRKYHGMLVSPIKAFGDAMHVLLSSLDISVIQHEQEFNLGLHKYEGNHYEPKGHKYLRDFSISKLPKFSYRVGGVKLSISKVLVQKSSQMLLKITLEDAHSATKIRLKPMLAFRNIHSLSKQNMDANTRTRSAKNGVISNLYNGYPDLFMQTSVKNDFVSVPLWYKDVEYLQEQKRGYEYKEDLFSPGYFELPIKVGQSIYFSAALDEQTPNMLSRIFKKEKESRVKRKTFMDFLRNAAQQFVVHSDEGVKLIAGYPWYDAIPRDTLIAAPSLLLENDDDATFLKIIDTLVTDLEIESGEIWGSKQSSVDAPLWLFNALHQYKEYVPKAEVWEKYGDTLKSILYAHKENRLHHTEFMENGMLYVYRADKPFSWMNSYQDDKPSVRRYGYMVEVCALWYNAICCAIQWAKEADDLDFVDEWNPITKTIEQYFKGIFTGITHNFLADYATFDRQHFNCRPNQLIAISLPYTPLDKETISQIKRLITQELLTPKGIRTLSPQHRKYRKTYEGNHCEREAVAYQGMVYPWLLSFYCEAYIKVHYRSIPKTLERILANFEEDILNYGVGTIGEMYDADPPHNPRGAISMATSVAALLRIHRLRKRWMQSHKIKE